MNEIEKAIEPLKQQSKIFREMADLLDKAIIAIENDEDDKVEEIMGVYLIKAVKLNAIKI